MIGALTDRVVLEAWCDSRDQPACARADALLACALDDGDDPDRWPLARRHAALAELHASRWGSRIDAIGACPSCGAEVAVEFDLAAVAAASRGDTGLGAALQPAPAPGDADLGAEPHPHGTPGAPAFRLPTRADVRAATHAADPRRALVERCLTGAAGELTAPALESIAAAMEAADPLGALELGLTCPDCECGWAEPLHVDEFLAAEARQDARVIAAEVHELALAYGWTEAEILALPAQRRRLYLELVCA